MKNKCDLCGGRGLEIFEGGYAGFCRQCYGFGSVIEAPVVEFCQFGFFTDKMQKAWDSAMNVTDMVEFQQEDAGTCQMVEE